MSEVRAVVAAHGGLAASLVEAVALISGRGERFVAVSNRGLDAAAMQALLADALRRSGARLVLTDLPAGSCTMAARRLQREDPSLVVISGVNLPLLLDLAMAEGDGPAALEPVVARAREHLRVWEVAGGH